MTEDTEPAVRVTLTTIWNEGQATKAEVQDVKRMIAERLPEGIGERVRKLEAQVAAQWVVVGLVVVGIGGLLTRTFAGG